MILYKFLSAKYVSEFIRKPRLRFSPVGELNDPFEMRPQLDALSEESFYNNLSNEVDARFEIDIMERRKRGLVLLGSEEKHRQLVEEWREFVQYAKVNNDALKRVRSLGGKLLYSDNIGVLSLTKNKPDSKDALLMWAFYGDNSRGAVIGIDVGHSVFRRYRELDGGLHFAAVDYVSCRPGEVFTEGRENYLKEMCFKKSMEWQYEAEYRFVVLLDQERHLLLDGQKKRTMFTLPWKAVRSVTFGANFCPCMLASLYEYIKQSSDRGVIERWRVAEFDSSSYAFKLERFDCGLHPYSYGQRKNIMLERIYQGFRSRD